MEITSNRAMGAEQNGECWYSTTNRVNKMATEVAKELKFARYATFPTRVLGGSGYLLGYPSTRIQILPFLKNRLRELATKWRFCIRVSASPRRYNALLKFWKYGNNVQSRDGGGTKWRMLVFYVQSREHNGDGSR
jgi:hypothetical protein